MVAIIIFILVAVILEIIKHCSAINLIKTYLKAIGANRVEYHWAGLYGRGGVVYFFKFYIGNDKYEGHLKYHFGDVKWIIGGGEVQSPIQFKEHLND